VQVAETITDFNFRGKNKAGEIKIETNTTLEAIITAQALNLGRSWWTFASQVAALANFYLTTWEEYHTGSLYLGVFSGPVEGILMLVGVYLITGIFGPSFWDTGLLDFLHLSHISFITNMVPNIGLNVTFMIIGAFGLGYNILSSYANVRKAMRASGQSTKKPLLLLIPFLFSAGMQLAWLIHPGLEDPELPAAIKLSRSSSSSGTDGFTILQSSLFVPFLCAWGLQFAHQVGRMILAHVTKGPFPMWDWVWIMSVVGAVDSNLPRIAGMPSILQSTPLLTALFVYATLLISLIAYARFCTLVINDITNFMGIACFTVRKKDNEGRWRNAQGEAPAATDAKKSK